MRKSFRVVALAATALTSVLLSAVAPAGADEESARKQAEAARIIFRGTVGHGMAETSVRDALNRALNTKSERTTIKSAVETKEKLASLRIEEAALQADEDALVLAKQELREAELSKLHDDTAAFSEASIVAGDGTFHAWFEDQMARRVEALEDRVAGLRTAIGDKRETTGKLRDELGLPARASSVVDELRLTAIDYEDYAASRQAGIGVSSSTDSSFRIDNGSKTLAFSTRYERKEAGSGLGLRPDNGWVTGRLNFIGSGTGSGSGGQEERFGVGAAYRLSDRVAASVNLYARNGTYALDYLGSRSTFHGVGATAGLKMRLNEGLSADLIAYEHPTWTRTTGHSGDGDYLADATGLLAKLSGETKIGELALRPSFSMRYKWTDTGDYTDDKGAYIPAQFSHGGEIAATVLMKRSWHLPDAVRLAGTVAPYVEVKYNRKMRKREEIAFSDGPTTTAGYSTAKAKVGAETKITDGASLKVNGYVYRRFDNRYRKAGTEAKLAVKF